MDIQCNVVGVSDAEDQVIFYNEDADVYVDGCGFPIRNIFREVHPNMVYLFRENREDMVVHGYNGDYIELIYEHRFPKSENERVIENMLGISNFRLR